MLERPFDGMTTYDQVGLLGKAVKQRWPLTQKGKEDSVDLIERVISDDKENMGHRVKCVELQIKMEAQNQTDERVQLLVGERGAEEPQVILILPNNGSEIMAEREESQAE